MGFCIVNDLEMKFVPYNLLALDFEFITTRLIKNKAKKYFQEIIEIGAVLRGDNKVLEFESVIKPRYYMQSKHKQVHTIYSERFSQERIENGIELEKAIDEVKKMYIEEDTIWISWGKAEYDILKTVCKNYGISFPFAKDDYLDLSKEFSRFYGIKQNISLDKALNILDITSVKRHEALPDARALMKIAEKMFIEGYEIQEKFNK